jgi:RimJ/RimL family protein N-acetyltransferase
MLARESTVSGHDLRDHAGSGPSRTLTIEPFEPWHLLWLGLQPEQAPMRPILTYEYGVAVQKAGQCFTAFDGPVVIACAGLVNCWYGRAQVWSLMSEHVPNGYGPLVHRAVTRFLNQCTIRRLELTVDPDFARAVAWARRLGFTYESTMPAYGPQGETQDLYVRIRKD